MNQRHAKWVEFMHNFTFVIKHISRSANKVADALSRRSLVIQEFQVKTLGFEHLKEMYQENIKWEEQMPTVEKSKMEKILEQRVGRKTRRKMYPKYLVKWKDHPVEDSSWVIEPDILKRGKIVRELMDRSP